MIGNIVVNQNRRILTIGVSVSETGLVRGTDNLQRKESKHLSWMSSLKRFMKLAQHFTVQDLI